MYKTYTKYIKIYESTTPQPHIIRLLAVPGQYYSYRALHPVAKLKLCFCLYIFRYFQIFFMCFSVYFDDFFDIKLIG